MAEHDEDDVCQICDGTGVVTFEWEIAPGVERDGYTDCICARAA